MKSFKKIITLYGEFQENNNAMIGIFKKIITLYIFF